MLNLNNKQRTIFCIVGRTCSGKDTIATKMINTCPDMFSKVVSYTTRPIRENETDGVEHYFVDKETFDKIRESEFVIAYTKIGEYEYMATSSELDKHNIYIIDPNGLDTLRATLDEAKYHIITIYVMAAYTDRKYRAVVSSNRFENEEAAIDDFNKRDHAETQMFSTFEMSQNYDIFVDNGGSSPNVTFPVERPNSLGNNN